jgi:hypothetical protein
LNRFESDSLWVSTTGDIQPQATFHAKLPRATSTTGNVPKGDIHHRQQSPQLQNEVWVQPRHRLKPASAILKPDKAGSNPNLFEQV